MQALLRDHSRHQRAQVSSTSNCRERNDRPFVAAATNNFSIRTGKLMKIAIMPGQAGAGRAQSPSILPGSP
jgi:hypothetical protein